MEQVSIFFKQNAALQSHLKIQLIKPQRCTLKENIMLSLSEEYGK